MEEKKQIKFIGLILKSFVAVTGIYILILILARKTATADHKLECCIMSGDSLLLAFSILFSYNSIKPPGELAKVSKYGNVLYIIGMATLLVTGFALSVNN